MSCSFCAEEAMCSATPELSVCIGCAARVAELAAEHDCNQTRIWRSNWAGPAVAATAFEPHDDGPDVETFKRDVAMQLADDNAGTHADLGVAYREMGLYDDAVREMGKALEIARHGVIAKESLCALLSAPLLAPDGIARLRTRLARERS